MSGTLPLHSTLAARALDERATRALGDDPYVLMQRAGQAAWQHLLLHWPEAQRIVVVCGPGSNGGDGYVLARHAHRAGRRVEVVHLPAHVPGNAVAQRACTDYVAAGGHVTLFGGTLPKADIVIDALFGIGLSRAPDAGVQAVIDAINMQSAPVFALDVPSGVDADRGSAPGVAVV
ncbi:MAG TPA: NAD(P)H-hydrate epimerase, partial [Pseudoxanthomonas sp.]|nr:NAD(P)H-hydrate epimerase [Pseudoxanthomonas sp.]